jgi:hypothetical protein
VSGSDLLYMNFKTYFMKKLYSFIIGILLSTGGFSQTGIFTYTSNLVVPSFSGLYSAQCSQAQNGDVWISATTGVIKFSGGVFTGPFSNGGPSIAPTCIKAVNNGVWVKRVNSIYFFDGTTWTDHTAQFPTTNQKIINHIQEVGTEIWFGTQEGIKVYNGSAWSMITNLGNGLPCDSVTYIMPVNTNLTLIGTAKGLAVKNSAVYTMHLFPVSTNTSVTNKVFSIATNGTRHFITRYCGGNLLMYEFTGSSLISTNGITKGDEIQTTMHARTMMFYNNGLVLPYQLAQPECGVYHCSFTNATTKNYLAPRLGSTMFYTNYLFPATSPNKVWCVDGSNNKTNVIEIDLNNYNYFYNSLTTNEFKLLDKNFVEAAIGGRNNKHWDILESGNAHYQVPKRVGGPSGSFARSMWIGGLDASNQLHMAGNTYRQSGYDFWPGPLDTVSGVSSTNPNYQKIWKVDCNDINTFVNAYNTGSVAASTYTVPENILTYPGNDAGGFQHIMSPFKDNNGDQLYNPVANGDYPLIRGHQQILSIYNDNYATHTETGALPMGVEVHEQSYAYWEPSAHDSMRAVNHTTFYYYTIYNRSNNNYHDVYITDWTDADLGNYNDDYVGTDSLNQFAYMYNADNMDQNFGGAIGYQDTIPVMATALINSNCANDGIDNNHNGNIDELNEQFLMDKVTYYNNNIGAFPPATTNPSTPWNHYNYMLGRWKDSTFFQYGGDAYNEATPSTNYVYTGNPQTTTGWTEATAGNLSGDRRLLMSSGPFNFPAHSKIEWGFALVFSRDSTVINTISKFNSIVQRDVRNVRWYEKMHQTPQCQPAIITELKELEQKPLDVFVYPNPATDLLNINLSKDVEKATIEIMDIIGRTIKSTTINNTYTARMPISELSSGVYLVSVNQNGKRSVVKWIKQ